MSSLAKWVSGRLHDVLGYSDRTTAQFVAALAGSARSASDLEGKLLDNGFPSGSATSSFARELASQAGQGSSSQPAKAVKRQPTQAELLQQSAQYSLIGDEFEGKKKKKDKKKKEKKKEKKRHMRRAGEAVADRGEDEESEALRRYKRKLEEEEVGSSTRQRVEGEEGLDLEEEEKKRQEEQDWIAAFNERLKKKDEDATRKKVGEKADVKALASLSTEEKKQLLPELRKRARQAYLQKREQEEIERLDASIRDEESVFMSERLTKAEMKRHELNKRILNLVKEKSAKEEDTDEGYRMPAAMETDEGRIDHDKREEILNARYKEEEVFKTEQELWEEDQAAKSGLQVGAKDRMRKYQKEQEKYDMVFEDQIDFLAEQVLPGLDEPESYGIKGKSPPKNQG